MTDSFRNQPTNKPNFIVITGWVAFPVFANDPVDALAIIKHKIDQRRYKRTDPEVALSLTAALDEGRLNFIVMDADRTAMLCGELNAIGDHTGLGEFQQPVSRELANTLENLIPSGLMPWREDPWDQSWGE